MPTANLSAPAVVARPRLISRALLLVYVADFAGLTSFYLLLPVMPQYAAASGAGMSSAGLTTAVLMAATVAAELAMPRLVVTFGHRRIIAGGLMLLGLPALVVSILPNPVAIMAVCVLRGLGLAVIFVVCGELGAALLPEQRRGEGLGLLGIVAGVPAVVAMPLGVWLVDLIGFAPTLLAGGLAALVGLIAVFALPRDPVPAEHDRPTLGVLAALRTPALLRPSIVFCATAVGAGAVLTFLPVAVADGGLASVALLAHALAAAASRWWAGRHGDRHGARSLLMPAALLSAVGVLTLLLVESPAAVVAGATIFGLGFGVVQNASLATMYRAGGASAFGAVTAVWSVAYDAGLGLGAAAFGITAGLTGFPAAFALTAVVVAAAVPFARRRRTDSELRPVSAG
jgi:predicted MFS family arabinose efflux permease